MHKNIGKYVFSPILIYYPEFLFERFLSALEIKSNKRLPSSDRKTSGQKEITQKDCLLLHY